MRSRQADACQGFDNFPVLREAQRHPFCRRAVLERSELFDQRPVTGGDVFNLIVAEDAMLAAVLSGTPPGPRPAPITDAELLQQTLQVSHANLQKVISSLSDSDLQTSVKLFGRDMTKQGALMVLLADQHEHLGQWIAYARSNSIVPPWSKWSTGGDNASPVLG
jgi:hypothetical protein